MLHINSDHIFGNLAIGAGFPAPMQYIVWRCLSKTRYDRSGQPYGTTPTPEIVAGFVSPAPRLGFEEV
jgi:hypothetical protein